MSDILKLTTPIVPKSYVNPNSKSSQQQGATQSFNLVDLTKVLKTNTQEEFQNSNMQLAQKQALAEKFFFNLIKDPSLAASSLKTFFEAYGDLTAADVANIKDINVENFVHLAKALGLDYNGLLSEVQVQSDGISLFKGEFFDLLREVYSNPQNEGLKEFIVPLLKAISTNHSNNDIYASLIENLKGLLKELPAQSLFAVKTQTIINSMRFINPNSPNWKNDFETLKNQMVTLLKEINISPFNTNKLENSTALIIYNLSFLNSSGSDPKEALTKLLMRIKDPKLAEELQLSFNRFMSMRTDPSVSPPKNSELIDSIASFVKLFQRSGKSQITDNPEINNILRSLIAAPNSFTPLLHFILPLRHNDTQAFAELWVDPYEESQEENDENKLIHLFLVIDIVKAGYFELEMTLRNSDLSLMLLCPEGQVKKYEMLKDDIALTVSRTPYTLNSVVIDRLVKPRKLTQVFPKLMQKRDGFDVKA